MEWINLKHFNVRLIPFLLCIVTVLSYANVLNGKFQFDDKYTIIENDFIKKLDNFLYVNWVQLFLSGGRSVTDITFALNYHLGRLNVFGYHLVNILIHISVIIVIYFFIRKTIGLAAESHPGIEMLSLTVAAIWGLHPIQTQVVSYISQRAEALNALFYLSSLMFFIRAIETGEKVKRIVFYCGGLVSFALSFSSKATAITLPVILLVYDYYFLKGRSLIKRLKNSGLLIIIGVVIAIIFLIRTGRSPYVGFSIETITPYRYLLTQMSVLLTYVRLTIFPVNQNLDYDYPIYNSFLNPEVFLSFLSLASIFGLGVYLLFKSKQYAVSSKQNSAYSLLLTPYLRLISFGILWFFIVLLPTSSVIPLRDVIMEHRLYLASLGIILSLTITGKGLLDAVMERYEVNRQFAISLILVPFILSILTFATNRRNTVWQNDLTLQRDVVSKSPGKPRAHYNLGTALLARGNNIEALSEFRKALECRDDGSVLRTQILINMGVTLLRMDRTDEALSVFQEGLKLSPADSYLLDNMAIVLKKKGRNDEAIKYANLSLMINPENSDMYSLKGKIYYEQGNYEKALEYYTDALKVNPDDSLIYWNTALTLEKMGRFQEAAVYYKHYFSRETEKTRRQKAHGIIQ